MSISKKLRFSVFKRDNFTCQYCGKTPPNVILEADHVISRKDGGQDDKMNLITACFACNRGKGASSVSIGKMTKKALKKECKILKEEKEQLTAYYNFIREKDELKDFELSIYRERWASASEGEQLEKKQEKSVKLLLSRGNNPHEILEAIDIAWSATNVDDHEKFRYMCGVLKRLRLQRDDPELAGRERRIRKELNKFFNYWNNQKRGSGYLRTRVIKEVEEIFNVNWKFEDVKPFIDEAHASRQQNYSDAFEEILNGSHFYTRNN
jgi:hypothetical protein|tara:strand:+ start:61 stop:858 length:798 start_codon:yes stop_codon:yes gene_type:complete